VQLSKSALSVSFNDTPSLLAVISKHITSEHIFFTLSRLVGLIFIFYTYISAVLMTSHMRFQSAWSHERERTYFATERSFTCVASLVVAQMTMGRERNLADVTFIGFNTFVDAIMNF